MRTLPLRDLFLFIAFMAMFSVAVCRPNQLDGEILGIAVISLLAWRTSQALLLNGKKKSAAIAAAVFGWNYLVIARVLKS